MRLQDTYERQLLARILTDKDVYFENSDAISAELFEVCREIFEAYREQLHNGRHPGLAKMRQLLPDRQQEIMTMFQSVDYDVPIQELITELEESRKMRVISEALVKATTESDSDSRIKTITDAVTSLYKSEKTNFETLYELAQQAAKDISERRNPGTPTGFRFFDGLTGGLHGGDLIILAAETSQGKTSLGLNIAENVSQAGACVAVISLEMTGKQVAQRMTSSLSDTPKGESEANWPRYMSAVEDFVNRRVHIADVTNNSVTHIMGLIRSAKIRFNVDVVVVDYLQLVSDKSQSSREQEIGHTARSLKNIAKELNINVIALSQLSRPKFSSNHFPTLARLRDSGQVEEAADIVMFIYRPEVYGIEEYDSQPTGGLAEIIIAKGRNYGTGRFFTRFDADITKFRDAWHREGGQDATTLAGMEESLPF